MRKGFTYKAFRHEYMRLKAKTIYERLLDDANARRAALRRECVPLTIGQCVDRDYETLPQERRLRPTEYEAFPYQDRRFDYTPSNTAGSVEAQGYCFSGRHRVPVSQLEIRKHGRLVGLSHSCHVCQERKVNGRKVAHLYRRAV